MYSNLTLSRQLLFLVSFALLLGPAGNVMAVYPDVFWYDDAFTHYWCDGNNWRETEESGPALGHVPNADEDVRVQGRVKVDYEGREWPKCKICRQKHLRAAIFSAFRT